MTARAELSEQVAAALLAIRDRADVASFVKAVTIFHRCVLLVGEAPGRRTNPNAAFVGGRTGDRMQELLGFGRWGSGQDAAYVSVATGPMEVALKQALYSPAMFWPEAMELLALLSRAPGEMPGDPRPRFETALRDWGTVEQHQALGTPTGGSMYAIQLYALAVAGPPALVRMILTAYGVTAQEIDGEGEGPASVGTTGG